MKTLLIFLSLLSVAFSKSSAQSRYTSPNHYSFSAPSNWGIIPKVILNEKMQKFGLEKSQYEVSIQLEKNNKIGVIKYPNIQLQFFPIESNTFQNAVNNVTIGFQKDLENYHSKEIDTNKVQLISYSKPTFDTSNNSITQNRVIYVNQKNFVKYSKTVFVGKFGYVVCNFYSSQEESLKYEQDLKAFYKTLTFEDGYKLTTPSKSNLNFLVKHKWLKIIIPISVSLLVFFLIVYYDKKKKRIMQIK